MKYVCDLIACMLLIQKYHRYPPAIKGVYFQIYDDVNLGERWGKRLQFGVTLEGQYHDRIQSFAIKFEEWEFGKFTVGVFSKEKNSIQYNLNVRFSLDDPLEKLVDAFPGNRYIRQFVDSLTSSQKETRTN